jgi:hypothetical protein
MIVINQENIEALLLDYFEQRLSPNEQSLLLDALESNAGWKAMFDEYAETPNVHLESEPLAGEAFHHDSLLKNDRDDDLIALCEGLLKPSEKTALLAEIETNKPLAENYQLYRLAFLKPDEAVVFAEKHTLLKGAPIISIFARYAAIAAVMSGVVFGLWRYNTHAPEKQYVARTSPPVFDTSAQATGEEVTPATTNLSSVAAQVNIEPINNAQQVATSETQANKRASESLAMASQPASNDKDEITPIKSNVQLSQVEKIDISSSAVLALNELTQVPSVTGAGNPPAAVELTAPAPEKSRKLIAKLADLAEAPVKKLLGKNVAIENEVIDENPTEPIYTSTFRMGPFGVYRSRSAK